MEVQILSPRPLFLIKSAVFERATRTGPSGSTLVLPRALISGPFLPWKNKELRVAERQAGRARIEETEGKDESPDTQVRGEGPGGRPVHWKGHPREPRAQVLLQGVQRPRLVLAEPREVEGTQQGMAQTEPQEEGMTNNDLAKGASIKCVQHRPQEQSA